MNLGCWFGFFFGRRDMIFLRFELSVNYRTFLGFLDASEHVITGR